MQKQLYYLFFGAVGSFRKFDNFIIFYPGYAESKELELVQQRSFIHHVELGEAEKNSN